MWIVITVGTIALITFYICIFRHKTMFEQISTGIVYEVLDIYSEHGYTVYKLQSTKDGRIMYIDSKELYRNYSEI